MILPFFMLMFVGVIEYGWFFFQRSSVIDAARIGCREASLLDPAEDTTFVAARQRVLTEIARTGLSCETPLDRSTALGNLLRGWFGGMERGTPAATCSVVIEDLREEPIPRIACAVEVAYTPITGMVNAPFGDDKRLLPATIRTRTSAIFEQPYGNNVNVGGPDAPGAHDAWWNAWL